MAGFLYFKPNHLTPLAPADIKAWGLGYAFTGPLAHCVCQRNTPNGQPGTVFADAHRMGELAIAMDMAQQDWRPMPGGDLYVGYWRNHKPTPEDLERPTQITGYKVKLADDQQWQIPLVRRFDVSQRTTVSNLPCYMELDEQGKWQRGQVLDVHAHLWNVTEPIADALIGEYVHGRPPVVDDEKIMAAIVSLLMANYVVSAAELSLMHAFTSEANTHAAVMSACDWPTFLQWYETDEQKKSALEPPPGGSTMYAGGMV